jgi:hypothetical protein
MNRWARSGLIAPPGRDLWVSRLKQRARLSAASRVTSVRSLSNCGFSLVGKRKASGPPPLGKVFQVDDVERFIDLLVEVVDMERIEVAEDDIAGAIGDEARPVVEGLLVVLAQVDAALLHFDEDNRLPDIVGEGGAAAVFGGFLDAKLRPAADIQRAFLTEGLE